MCQNRANISPMLLTSGWYWDCSGMYRPCCRHIILRWVPNGADIQSPQELMSYNIHNYYIWFYSNHRVCLKARLCFHRTRVIKAWLCSYRCVWDYCQNDASEQNCDVVSLNKERNILAHNFNLVKLDLAHVWVIFIQIDHNIAHVHSWTVMTFVKFSTHWIIIRFEIRA